jgi:hypothetical protein
MKRRSLFSRALVAIGAIAAPVAAKSSPWHGKGFYERFPVKGPWELLRWTKCDHVDGNGVSLVMELRCAYHDTTRLLVRDCHRKTAKWLPGQREVVLASMKAELLAQLDDLNAREIMDLYA